MKFTIIGDTHSKPDNIDKLNILFNQVEEIGFPTIWLGDMLDTKEIVRASCLNNYIKYFKHSKLEHIVLVGNHDWFNLKCEQHSLEPLKLLNTVRVVDKPIEINNIQLIPYSSDLNLINKWIDQSSCKYLIGHLDIIGFDWGNGYISNAGLNKDKFNKFERIISGHYHKYQEKNNILYVGTPFSHHFGESNQDKFIIIFNSENNSVTNIKTTFPAHKTKVIHTDQLNNIINLGLIDHELKLYQYQEDYLRFIIEGKSEEMHKIIEYIKRYNNNWKFIENPETLVFNDNIDEADDNMIKFSKWATEVKKIDTNTIDLGIKFLKESL